MEVELGGVSGGNTPGAERGGGAQCRYSTSAAGRDEEHSTLRSDGPAPTGDQTEEHGSSDRDVLLQLVGGEEVCRDGEEITRTFGGCRHIGACSAYSPVQLVGLVLGPLLACVLSFVPLSKKHPKAQLMLGQVAWMVMWWLCQVVPLPVTCLLPIVTFPLLGITPAAVISAKYFNAIIFLFLGALIVDHGIEKVELHKRFALKIILGMGTSPHMQLLAMMLVTAILSGFCSNSSTTLMMVPFVLGVLEHAEADAARSSSPKVADAVHRYSSGLLIGVAWAASIGGSATLIGTAGPPVLATIYAERYPGTEVPLTFGTWSAFAAGISLVMFVLAYCGLSLRYCLSQDLPGLNREMLQRELSSLGKMTRDEVIVAGAQIFQIVLWFGRGLILQRFIGRCTEPLTGSGSREACLAAGGLWSSPFASYDAGIACAAAVALFVIPSSERPPERILDWQYVNSKMPWDILLLLGGGFAVSTGFLDSGLSLVITEALTGLAGLPLSAIILIVTLVVTFLTELTSNAATASIMVPVLASVADGLHVHPMALLLPGTYATGCAFMLPIATPPNAIVYATHRLQFTSMMPGGLILNIVGSLVILLFTQTVAKSIFGGGSWQLQTPL